MNTRLGILSRLFAKKAGTDSLGNQYFYRPKGKGRREKRWVVYKGMVEASKVPPVWHAWLHHVQNNLPTEADQYLYSWQQPPMPNLTGTPYAYQPIGQDQAVAKAMDDYQAWQPDSSNLTPENSITSQY